MTLSFYADHFFYIPNVWLPDAKKVLSALNDGARPPTLRDLERHEHGLKKGDLQYVDEKYNAWMRDMSGGHIGVEERAMRSQTPGYVTKDVSASSYSIDLICSSYDT